MPKLKYLSSLKDGKVQPKVAPTPEPEPTPPLPIDPEVLDDPDAIAAYTARLHADFLKGNLAAYVQEMWPVVEPSTKLTWNWHHELVCRVLQGMFEDWEKAQDDDTFVQRVQNALFSLPPGSLKPCHVDGLVTEKTKGLIRLGDVKKGDLVLTHQGRYRKVLAIGEQGELPLRTFITGRGRIVKVAPDHPMLTQRGWIQAADVTTTDVLASTFADTNETAGTQTISAEEARLLGYIIGDGSIRGDGSVSFVNSDMESLDDFESCAKSLGLDTLKHERPRSLRASKGSSTHVVYLKSKKLPTCACGAKVKAGSRVCYTCTKLGHKSNWRDIPNWIAKHNLADKKSATKRVPAAIMAGNEELIKEYLAAYWACDGTIHDRRDLPRAGRKNQTTQTVRVSATTISEDLAEDHQALLQRLGLNFRVRTKVTKLTKAMVGKDLSRVGQPYTSYDVVASDQDTAAKFMQVIGPYMRHEKRTRAPNLPRTDFDRVLKPDNIVSITDNERGECRCLQVEEDSSFVYQGVAVHNSRLVSVGFPTWCWLRRPSMRFICLSVNLDAAQRDARDSRTVIRSDWYQETFEPDWQINDDQDAITSYGNSARGVRLSRAQGSEIVGLRGDCLAGNTMIATEWGDIPIEKLHAQTMSGGKLPRVWTMNHTTNMLELKRILGSRVIEDKEVVDIRTQTNNMLRCTDAHKIYSQGDYTQASHLSGRSVSVMQRTDMPIQKRNTTTLPELPICDTDLRTLSHGISEIGCRIRQTGAARPDGGSILFQVMQDDTFTTGNYKTMHHLPEGLPAKIYQNKPAVLFGSMSEHETKKYTGHQEMSGVLSTIPTHEYTDYVLQSILCKRGTLNTHVGTGEFQLFGQTENHVRGRVMVESGSADPRARQQCMHRVRDIQRKCESGTGGSSCGSQPFTQHTREPGNVMQRVSHVTPQIQESTVLSVNKATKNGSRIKISVYDLHIEGNHNFFANGILVHNCILNDDPNNPKEAESKTVRDEVNELWTTNIFNRVNDPIRSMRIGVQQRTHARDWTGYVTSTDGTWHPTENRTGWLVVALPAEFEPERRCITPWGKDPRKVAGQSIDEVRMPKEWLVKERARFGSAKYAGQMQQRPALAEGGRVKKQWWGWFTLGGISERGRSAAIIQDTRGNVTHYPWPEIRAPGDAERPHGCDQLARVKEVGRNKYYQRWDFDWVMITVDPAVKKTIRGSNFGILVVGAQGMRRFILEDATQKGDIIEIVALLKQLTARWRPDKILIEEKAAGHDIMLMLREQIADGDVRDASGLSISTIIEPINPGAADKEMRLDACIPQIEAGLIYLLEGSEWKEFIDEFAQFPAGSNDDRVDALSQLLNFVKSDGGYDLPEW